ncbi:MAG: hypothetical protein CM15mP83_5280 [Flavobacteriaceae bacterium]|nr:MAG: hypothetical protein CM15mP83_5280 [Flavobacteriaceae bacterium]
MTNILGNLSDKGPTAVQTPFMVITSFIILLALVFVFVKLPKCFHLHQKEDIATFAKNPATWCIWNLYLRGC